MQGLTLKNYTPGYTYEFTAYFMDSDIGKPEPVQTYMRSMWTSPTALAPSSARK